MFKHYIGDRAFYRRALMVAVPIIIQNGITNFVSLLDNIMVGQIGTLQMSGVSIVNTLIYIFNLCIFGATSGPGIFTAQFYGSGDTDGVRHTFRFKNLVCLLLTVLSLGIFAWYGEDLIMLYLKGDGNAAAITESLGYGTGYLDVMLWGLVPFALATSYSDTLRETGETLVPMIAGVVAVFVNLGLNYVLIFGHFGAPALGVEGAAIATVISRYVELAIVAFWTHANPGRNPFIVGAYRSLYIPGKLLKAMTLKGLPLLCNEFLWASGIAAVNQFFSTRGLDVVASFTISTTLTNLTNVVFLAIGTSVGIIIGQMLGSGCTEAEVRDADRKLIALSVSSCVIFSTLMILFSGAFPKLYNTTSSIQHLASVLICINALIMPFNAYTNAAYFTLRSGGETTVTFLFDSCFMWVVVIPVTFAFTHLTALAAVPLYAISQAIDLVKVLVGHRMIKNGMWIKNLTEHQA